MHGTVTLPRQSSSSEDTKVAQSLSGSLCPHLCWGRAETSSPGCAQHISFYPVCQCSNTLSLGLHRILHCGQIGMPGLSEPQRTIRLAVTTQRYSALMGYRWGEMQSQSHGPGGERTVGPFCFKLQATDFSIRERLSRSDLEIQNNGFFSELKHQSRHLVWVSWNPLF